MLEKSSASYAVPLIQSDGDPTAFLDIISPSVVAGAEDLARSYKSAAPYPHIVIDNFLRPEIAAYVDSNFPTMEQMPTVFKEPMSYKGQLSDIRGKWPRFSDIFVKLQSQAFRDLMTTITGIEAMLDDPVLAGGGLHQSPKSGFLDIHVDANFHPDQKTLHRRVNIIIYITPGWRSDWGGELQLWSNNNNNTPKKVVQSVAPIFNRAVIFNTDRTSWHGVTPINCPDGVSRRSLALYYYTNSRPDAEIYRDSSVIWMNRSVLWKRALYPVMNKGIALLKPYAKQLRAVVGRDKVFDAGAKAEKSDPTAV